MTKKTILLVEDNPSELALMKRAIAKCSVDFEVIVVRDGQAALDYLFGAGAHLGRDTSVQPSLILLDLKMPKVDGLTVLKRIKSEEKTHRIPVVIMTSSNQEKDRARGYELGVNSYICKPVNFDEFTKTIEQLGRYWLVLNEPSSKEADKT